MKQRRVVKRVGVDTEAAPSVLQRAADQLQNVLGAEVVFIGTLDSGGVLHCHGVAPHDNARLAPVSLGELPAGAAVLDDRRRALFAASYAYPLSSTIVSVPVHAGDGTGMLATAVMEDAPDARCLRLLDAWAQLLGECVEGERAQGHLQQRTVVIRQLRDVLDVTLTMTAEAVVTIDLDGRVVRWNQASQRLYGWAAEEVIGTVLPMVDRELHTTVLSRIRQGVFEGGVTRVGGVVQRTADGKVLQISVTLLPMHDDDGDLCGAICVMQDESAEVREYGCAAPAVSSAAMARLTAPVTAVSGYLQLLQRGDALNDPEVRERVLRGLRRRCGEIADISEELRLAARLLEPGPQLQLMTEDPRCALSRALDRSAEAGSGRVTVQMAKGLTMRVDPDCLDGALTGLLRGLLRSSPEDAVLTAVVESSQDGVGFVFSARFCEGVGIGEHPESGLGIHLAQLCAQAHGGRFGVRSMRDTTEIRLTIPAGTRAN